MGFTITIRDKRDASDTRVCRHCGQRLAMSTPERGHEASMTCQAARNKKEMIAQGLARCNGGRVSTAYTIAKVLGIEGRDVVDSYTKGAYRPGRKSTGCYLPAWIVALFDRNYLEAAIRLGYVSARTRWEDSEDRDLHELLLPVARKALADEQVRAALEAAFAVGGVDAIIGIAGKELP